MNSSNSVNDGIYARWLSQAKDKLKEKLSKSLNKRVECIEHTVNDATEKIINDNLIPVINCKELLVFGYMRCFCKSINRELPPNYILLLFSIWIAAEAKFRVSSTIRGGALERMNHIIESWEGIDFSQCQIDRLPRDFKRYWRLADNWYAYIA